MSGRKASGTSKHIPVLRPVAAGSGAHDVAVAHCVAPNPVLETSTGFTIRNVAVDASPPSAPDAVSRAVNSPIQVTHLE